MSVLLEQSSKTVTAGSPTVLSSNKSQPLRRRRTRMLNEKKIADDEFMAAAIGDVEWLKQSMKDSGSQINFDKNGLTAFHLASIHGRLECLKLCIEKFKYDVNLPSSTGWRPVHLVISNQTGKRAFQCLKYLLEKGANPSVTNDDLITPAHQASSEGHVQCLKLLIEAGAEVNSKDCRGNTPLDLAKLWSQRDCGRILAAEIWHKEKDYVAKEMNHLQKLKIKQVLKELEEEEERHTAQAFYGEKAFKDWLSTRNLNEKPTGPVGKTEYNYDESARQAKEDRHPLLKANSIASHRKSLKSDQQSKSTSSSPSKEPTQQSLKRHPTYNTDYTEDFESDDEMKNVLLDSRRHDHIQSKLGYSSGRRTKLAPVEHPSPWNTSTKSKESEYIPILKDEYPRDEYTLMPKVKPEQKYFDGKHAKPRPSKEEKKEETKTRAIDLPQDVVDKVLSRDPSILERPVLFKPKHVMDLPIKKKLNSEVKPKDEVSLHLCSDITSVLFKNSLKICPPSSAKSSSSSSSTSISKHRDQDLSPSMIAMAMKQLANGSYFPKTAQISLK